MSRSSVASPVAPAGPGGLDAQRAGVPVAPVAVRRRPAFLFGSVAAVLVGGLLSAFLWVSASTTTEVVLARNTVERGAAITQADLTTVRIGVDPAVGAIPASQVHALVGKRAALDIAAGTPLTAAQLTEVVVPGEGQTVVGLLLAPGSLPAIPLKVGDRVRVIQPATTVAGQPAAVPVTVAASVVGVSKSTDGRATLVDVAVPADAAAELAAQTSSGKIVLVLDSRVR